MALVLVMALVVEVAVAVVRRKFTNRVDVVRPLKLTKANVHKRSLIGPFVRLSSFISFTFNIIRVEVELRIVRSSEEKVTPPHPGHRFKFCSNAACVDQQRPNQL